MHSDVALIGRRRSAILSGPGVAPGVAPGHNGADRSDRSRAAGRGISRLPPLGRDPGRAAGARPGRARNLVTIRYPADNGSCHKGCREGRAVGPGPSITRLSRRDHAAELRRKKPVISCLRLWSHSGRKRTMSKSFRFATCWLIHGTTVIHRELHRSTRRWIHANWAPVRLASAAQSRGAMGGPACHPYGAGPDAGRHARPFGGTAAHGHPASGGR